MLRPSPSGARTRRVSLVEAIEDVGEMLGKNTRSSIGNLDQCFVVGLADLYHDVYLPVLDGVANEVRDDTLEACGGPCGG